MEDQNEKKYISSGILFEMAKDEYTKERERANALDNKASFFITVIVAVSTIFVPIIPFGRLISLYQKGACTQKCIVSVLLVLIVIAVAFLISAFIKLYGAYRLTDYKRPNLECISTEGNHTAPNDQLYKGLCDHYKTVVDYNIIVNGKKCDTIAEGIKACGIGLFLLIISTVALIITIGG